MTLEHSPEYEGTNDVLAPADDRQEVVQTRSARTEVVVAAGENMEAQRQFEIDRGPVKIVVDGAVVIFDLRIARHHHALEPQLLDLAQVLDSLLRRAHRSLATPDEPGRIVRAIFGDPEIVSVEAGFLVVVVLMVAEQHPDR